MEAESAQRQQIELPAARDRTGNFIENWALDFRQMRSRQETCADLPERLGEAVWRVSLSEKHTQMQHFTQARFVTHTHKRSV